jgi:L-alanine-DL-glutamate epimerase-like enolase superfamily enzyme
MKIADIRADSLKSGRMLVRVFTDEGLTGLAEHGGRNPGVMRAYVDETIKPYLAGKDPRQVDRHWEALAYGAGEYVHRLPATVVGSIDIALWDILGKSAGLPCHTLMGGAARKEIPCYWSIGNGWKKTPEQMLADIKAGWDQGFRHFKIRMDWRWYRQDANPAKDFAMFKLVREFLPKGIYLGFDANNGYSVSTAISQGVKMQELGFDHFEEPLPQYDFHGLRQVCDALDVAITTGEQEPTRWQFVHLIALGNPDILQPDVLISGGISEMQKIYALAVAHNKPVMPHSPTAGVNSMASLHLYSTLANATRPHEYSTEFSGDPRAVQDLFNEPLLPEKGVMKLSDKPGWGLTLNEAALKKQLA